jgi:hypothetical protein
MRSQPTTLAGLGVGDGESGSVAAELLVGDAVSDEGCGVLGDGDAGSAPAQAATVRPIVPAIAIRYNKLARVCMR